MICTRHETLREEMRKHPKFNRKTLREVTTWES